MTLGLDSIQPLGVLLVISAPGSALNLDDHDIVTVLQASAFPGKAVVGATDGRYHFVYLTDVTADSCGWLAEPLRGEPTLDQLVDPDSDLDDVPTLAKRKYCCVMTGKQAETCTTYRTFEDAPADQKMTWSEFATSYCVNKADG